MPSGRRLTVFLSSDTKKFRKGLDQGESRMRRFGRSAVSIAKGIGVGVTAGLAVASAAVVKAVDQASDFNETIGKASQVFGQKYVTGLKRWGEGAARAMGLSKTEAIDTATSFAQMGKQAGLSGSRLVRWAKRLTAFAGDLASFNNTSVPDAAQALQSGLRGESEPLRRYSINLSDAALQARGLALHLVKATRDTLKIKQAQLTASRAQDTYTKAVKKHGLESSEAKRASDALDIAQAKLANTMKGSVPKLTAPQKTIAAASEAFHQGEDAIGDYERTADGLANSARTIGAQWENLGTNFGEGLLEGFTQIDEGSGDVKDSLEELQGTAKDVGRWIGDMVASAVGSFKTFALGALQVNNYWEDIADSIGRANDQILDWTNGITDEEAQRRNDERDANKKRRDQFLASAAFQTAMGSTGITTTGGGKFPQPPREPSEIPTLGQALAANPDRIKRRTQNADARSKARSSRSRARP